MSSEWIKHDGSRRCPVEPEALVHVRSEHGGTVGDPRLAHRIEWSPLVKEYTVISGWSRPLADIFAELPPEAEWIAANLDEDRNWFKLEPIQAHVGFVRDGGMGTRGMCDAAAYYGDWRESKRKRPESELPEIERVDLPIHYTMTNAELLEAIKLMANLLHSRSPKSCAEYGKYSKQLDALLDVQRSRAVASFTAKVERTTYENGGE